MKMKIEVMKIAMKLIHKNFIIWMKVKMKRNKIIHNNYFENENDNNIEEKNYNVSNEENQLANFEGEDVDENEEIYYEEMNHESKENEEEMKEENINEETPIPNFSLFLFQK